MRCSPQRSIATSSCVSTVICLAVFALSIVDRGRASFGLNIALPIITLIYHAIIFFSYRRLEKAANESTEHVREEPFLHPTATTASLICVFVLILLWFTAFGLINGFKQDFTHNSLFSSFKPGGPVTVGIQMGLDSGEAGVLIGIATTSLTVRIIADRKKKAAASCVFLEQFMQILSRISFAVAYL
jgi:heme/copper-type cytochrome/quinol oxidase subunit 2